MLQEGVLSSSHHCHCARHFAEDDVSNEDTLTFMWGHSILNVSICDQTFHPGRHGDAYYISFSSLQREIISALNRTQCKLRPTTNVSEYMVWVSTGIQLSPTWICELFWCCHWRCVISLLRGLLTVSYSAGRFPPVCSYPQVRAFSAEIAVAL